MMAPLLKLLAVDAEDLIVLSAALQDAVLTVGDLLFEPKARQFSLVCNRLMRDGYPHRVRCGVQFGQVLAVATRGIDRANPDHVLQILALTVEPSETNSTVLVTFAGGADLRLSVEDVDVILADVSDPWPVRRLPDHEL